MSISDFTLTSPRKSVLKNNRSITYDEEFEKFLNDTSESDLSTNRYVKPADKLWWEEDEIDQKEIKRNGTKSFIKQQPSQSPNKFLTKSKKLTTTQETVEEIPENETKKEELNENLTNLPKLSFDNSSYSNNRFEETKQSKSFSEAEDETPTDNVLSSPESKQSVIERNVINKVNEIHNNKEIELIRNVSNNENDTNLLSKVIFIDTITSGEVSGNTLNQKTIQAQRQVQINDTRIDNNDTQTRRDLNEIEDYYRNYNFTDSGLNTLIKTNHTNDSNNLQRENIIYEDNHDKSNSYSNENFGLKAIQAIKTELENRALKTILKELEKESKEIKPSLNRKNDLLPEKFKNIKSTGYGTSWSPSTYIGHFHRNPQESREFSRESRPKSIIKDQILKVTNKRTSSNNSSDINFNGNQNEIIIKSLKTQIVKRETDHENQIKEIRQNYEIELNELKDKLNKYNNQPVNENNYKLIQNSDEKYKEQENLIKAYQLENERLYSDLKLLKEKNKTENQNLVEQINALKFNHIQEKIEFENKIKFSNLSNKPLDKSSSQENPIDLNTLEEIKNYQKTIILLKERLSFLENNQRKSEIDINEFDSKNKEIKVFKENLQKFEKIKTPNEYLKQIKLLKNQIKEMKSIINRLKQPVSSSNSSEFVSMNINFYEMKIKELEDQIKEKDFKLERSNRLWEQKYIVLQQKLNNRKNSKSPLSPRKESESNDISKKINPEYLRKVEKEIEKHLNEKQSEIDKIKLSKDAEIELLNRKLELKNKKKVKIYQPKEFFNIDNEIIQSTNLKSNDEIDLLNIKLNKTENELKQSKNENALEMINLKKMLETKMNDLIREHKIEIEKLLRIFTGGSLKTDDFGSDHSVLNDPIQIRILLSARDKHNEMRQTIEKQKLLIKKFNEHCNELNVYRDKCIYLEEKNKILNEHIEEFKSELDAISLNSTLINPINMQYEFLKNKIKKLEINMLKRDKIENLTFTNKNDFKLNELKRYYENQLEVKNREINKFRLEFDSMLQLLHSLQ